MADSWWDRPEDTVENPADGRSYWYNNQLHGERLDPNALGVYGTPNPTNYLDRTPSMNSDVGGRMARELYKLYQSGQLGDDEAYKGFMGESRGYSDETILDALRRQGGSYLTRISDGGGAAPPNEARGLRDEDNIKRFNELEGESGRGRFQAYRDWQSQATPEELVDQALEGGYRTPTNLSLGYAEGDKMPLPASRDPGINALIDEQTTREAPPREQALVEALHGARSGLPRSMSTEDLTNYMSGQPIRSEGGGAAPPPPQDQPRNYLSGALSSAEERLHPLESYMMDKLENSPDIGFEARNNFPHDKLVDMIMRKYGLAESGRQHAEDYATELRLFSNPSNYRNFEPEEGISNSPGVRIPFEEQDRRRQGYQPISDVQQSDRDMRYRRPPLASGIAPLPNARGFEPLVDLQGGVSPIGRRSEREPLNFRAMYRRTFPF